MKELRPYQQVGFELNKDQDSAYLAMEMRLGKTLLAIRLLQHWCVDKVLVFAPSTVLIAWEMELEDEGLTYFNLSHFTLDERATLLSSTKSTQYFLLNYESMSPMIKHLDGMFDAVVMDESVKIKNTQSKVTKSALKMCDGIRKKICLSGLPTPNDWLDIFTQMAFLNDGRWMGCANYYKWREKYFCKDFSGYNWTLRTPNKNLVKKCFQQEAYVLTRKQAGIKETKIRTRREIELPAAGRKYHDYVLEHWESPDEGRTFSAKQAMVVGIHLHQYICRYKVDELLAVLEELPKDEQVIVWFSYNDQIETVRELLEKKAVAVESLTGADSARIRKRRITYFSQNKIKVLLVQQAVGQYGIRLDSASVAIYFSTSHNFDHRAQSEDRIVDVTKKTPLYIIDIVVKDTVEDGIYECLEKKKSNAEFLLSQVGAARQNLGEHRSWNAGYRPRSLVRERFDSQRKLCK